MPYTERYVAFLDILGFSRIVVDSSRPATRFDADSLMAILKGIGTRDDEYDKIFGVDFRFQTFSDSIVMSETASKEGFEQITDEIEALARKLLSKGLLLRGGLAKGALYHKGTVMFGPAFLDAYRLESTVAKYPRVVLSRDVFADHKKYDRLFSRVVLADDGPPYVNVLQSFKEVNNLPNHPVVATAPAALQGIACQNALQLLIDESIYEPNHYEKLKWFGIYWNSNVGVNPDNLISPVTFPNAAR
jgi:hypothetical protein